MKKCYKTCFLKRALAKLHKFFGGIQDFGNFKINYEHSILWFRWNFAKTANYLVVDYFIQTYTQFYTIYYSDCENFCIIIIICIYCILIHTHYFFLTKKI